ncbi:roundabout 2-like, partial [Clarias magur]
IVTEKNNSTQMTLKGATSTGAPHQQNGTSETYSPRTSVGDNESSSEYDGSGGSHIKATTTQLTTVLHFSAVKDRNKMHVYESIEDLRTTVVTRVIVSILAGVTVVTVIGALLMCAFFFRKKTVKDRNKMHVYESIEDVRTTAVKDRNKMHVYESIEDLRTTAKESQYEAIYVLAGDPAISNLVYLLYAVGFTSTINNLSTTMTPATTSYSSTPSSSETDATVYVLHAVGFTSTINNMSTTMTPAATTSNSSTPSSSETDATVPITAERITEENNSTQMTLTGATSTGAPHQQNGTSETYSPRTSVGDNEFSSEYEGSDVIRVIVFALVGFTVVTVIGALLTCAFFFQKKTVKDKNKIHVYESIEDVRPT